MFPDSALCTWSPTKFCIYLLNYTQIYIKYTYQTIFLQICAAGSRCATPICRRGCPPKADPSFGGNLQGAPRLLAGGTPLNMNTEQTIPSQEPTLELVTQWQTGYVESMCRPEPPCTPVKCLPERPDDCAPKLCKPEKS